MEASTSVVKLTQDEMTEIIEALECHQDTSQNELERQGIKQLVLKMRTIEAFNLISTEEVFIKVLKV